MTQPIPVICDRCRTAGEAGEEPFADLADLLSFTPVVRRARADGWDAERQRAFIAALAVTGSPRAAARAIGKHAFGAEQLRKARGGTSFAAAWDAAIDIARERELAALKDDMTELAADHEAETGRRRSALLPAHLREPLVADEPSPVRPLTRREEEDAESDAQRQDYLDAHVRIRARLTKARRLFLAGIAGDPARRAAWEALVGPVDWDRAERLEAQADEPFNDDPENPEAGGYAFRNPDMILTAEAGLIAEFTGGPDRIEELREEVERIQAEEQSSSLSRSDGGAEGVAQQQLADRSGDGGAA